MHLVLPELAEVDMNGKLRILNLELARDCCISSTTAFTLIVQ
jgi:hypothetical protein